MEQSLNMSYNITNVSCSFAKNDKNILLNEVDTGGIKGLGLCACSFLVGIGLLISVLSGIILVHKYNISSATLSRLKHDYPVSTTTIDKLCKILQCNVGDILEHREDQVEGD